jgi:hypothetical protein
MNEQTENLINQALAGAIENAVQAKDFVLSEAPEVLEQLILFKTVEHCFFCVFGIALVATFFFLIKPFIKACNDVDDAPYDKEGLFILKSILYGVFGIISIIIGLILFSNNLVPAMKVIFAPKIYLIEYAAQLMS